MERYFYTADDFEELLKENADQFKMTPSKKVWHGIYNDIQPGRRWPSAAMSLVFIFTLILVGRINTHQTNGNELSGDSVTANNNISNPEIKNVNSNTVSASNNLHTAELLKSSPNLVSREENITVIKYQKGTVVQNEDAAGKKNIDENKSFLFEDNYPDESINGLKIQKSIEGNETRFTVKNSSPILQSLAVEINTNIDKSIVNIPIENNSHKTKKSTTQDVAINKPLSLRKIHRNPKVSWAMYVSPVLSYRHYTKEGNVADAASYNFMNSIINNNTSLSKSVTHSPSAGLEAGLTMKYAITPKINVTTGIQANYSAYSIQANNIHPTIATLMLHDYKTGTPYPYSTISFFGNGPGNVPVNLHNYNLSLSLPVGLEYQLGGNANTQFFITASLQPSINLTNHSYILSTDKKTYLTDASLARNFNLGTNIGTSIAFTSSKFKWQLGPQIRYQLMSSYISEYQVREHYIDYSIRLAISKLRK